MNKNKILQNPLINKKIAKWIKRNDDSEKSEPYLFIRKDDLEEYLGLPTYYFSEEDGDDK